MGEHVDSPLPGITPNRFRKTLRDFALQATSFSRQGVTIGIKTSLFTPRTLFSASKTQRNSKTSCGQVTIPLVRNQDLPERIILPYGAKPEEGTAAA